MHQPKPIVLAETVKRLQRVAALARLMSRPGPVSLSIIAQELRQIQTDLATPSWSNDELRELASIQAGILALEAMIFNLLAASDQSELIQ